MSDEKPVNTYASMAVKLEGRTIKPLTEVDFEAGEPCDGELSVATCSACNGEQAELLVLFHCKTPGCGRACPPPTGMQEDIQRAVQLVFEKHGVRYPGKAIP
jgi:hypothetical protein